MWRNFQSQAEQAHYLYPAYVSRVTRFLLIGLISLTLFLAIHLVPVPAIAQRYSIPNIAEQVYQQLPNLPRENQYISTETGQVSSTNSLISRLIRYHTLTKGRSQTARFDWKLTLADYLGAHERMFPETYPSADTLRTNPMTADVAAIRQLNRLQREQLITALLAAFDVNPNPPTATPVPQATPSPSATPRPSAPTALPPGSGTSTPLPRDSRPGDAQLLLP